MKIIRLFYNIILLTLLFTTSGNAQEITDLIAPVKLISGQPDTMYASDLFYSGNYNLKFIPDTKVQAQTEGDKIIFTPDMNFEGFTTSDFMLGDETYSIPVYVKKIVKTKFSFKPEKEYKSVNLFGAFNSWDRYNLPMKDNNGDGTYSTEIPLEPGQYQYKFFCDSLEILDPENPVTVPNGLGGYNSVVTVPEKFPGKSFLHLDNYSGKFGATFSFIYENSNYLLPLRKEHIFVFLDNKRIEKVSADGNLFSVDLIDSQLEGKLKGNKTLRVVVNYDGNVSNMQVIKLVDGKPLTNENKDFSWYDGTIYSLMIDRFSDGDKTINHPVENDSVSWNANYEGGDFQGVINEINAGYFDRLGVNILWLSPIYDNPDQAYREYPAPHRWYSGYHGYWPISAVKTEENFGTMGKFKELVETAHKHGIKVLLDFVSHHVHELHPYFKNHRDWFGNLKLPDGRLNLRFWDEFRLTTWFEPYLPSFDFIHSQQAVDTMTDNALWWLKTTGADGFRHDAVKHVPNNFWRELTAKLKKNIEVPERKNVFQIGETFGSYDLVNSYINNGQLSSQFNFELYNTALAVFIDSTRSFSDLNAEMKKSLEVFGPLNLMGNIMDSHDKVRYMAYTDGDITLSEPDAVGIGWKNPPVVDHPDSYKKAELYYAHLFSIPGLPVIYYGSEFGMTGAADPDNRRMMRFGNELNSNEKNMLNEVRKISNIRKEHTALRYGDFYPLISDKDIYAYIRSDFNERILVVLNKSGENQNVDIELPGIYGITKAVNLADENEIETGPDVLNLELDRYGWAILKLE